MSLLLSVLAASGGAGGPVGGDDGEVTPALTPAQQVRADLTAALDPAGRTHVYRVGVDAPTISGCLALADAVAGPTSGPGVPLVMIPPGVYAERVTRPRGGAAPPVDVRSTTLDPADVVLDPGAGATDDTWEHYGSPGILAGLTLYGRGAYSAIHSGEYGQDATVDEFIYFRVVASQERATGNDAFSWGVGPRQHVYAIDVELRGPGRVFYVHNFEPGQPAAGALVLDGVTQVRTGAGSAAGGGNLLMQDSGQPDHVTIIGGSWSSGLGMSLYNGATTSSWVGSVDPAVANVSISGAPGITRSLPAAHPRPLRIEASA